MAVWNGPFPLKGNNGIPGLDGTDGEDAPIVPGPAGAAGVGLPGATGAQGPPGFSLFEDPCYDEPMMPAAVVQNAQLGLMPSATIKGNSTGQRWQPTDLTAAQVYVILNLRVPLLANATYFVTTTGSDLGAGSILDPWLTIQHAVDFISNLDLNGHNVTVNVAAGTYTSATTLKTLVGVGTVTILGVGDTTLISTTSATCFTMPQVSAGLYVLDSMKLQTATSGDCVQTSSGSGVINLQNINFGACATSHMHAVLNGTIFITGNYTVSGNIGKCHYFSVGTGSTIGNSTALTVTISASITVAGAWAQADRNAEMELISITYSLGAFTVTGQRYIAQNGGGIFTAGGGANFFPGSVAGVATSPGWYA